MFIFFEIFAKHFNPHFQNFILNDFKIEKDKNVIQKKSNPLRIVAFNKGWCAAGKMNVCCNEKVTNYYV